MGLLFMLGGQLTWAQDGHKGQSAKADKETHDRYTIYGRVVDEEGEPLPGAQVKVKGSKSNGAICNNDGDFVFHSSEQNPTLSVSFMGMKTKQVVFKGKKLHVTLLSDTKTMKEVEIVQNGYMKLPREDMVGAYTTLKSEDFVNDALVSVDQMLQGKVAGMAVENTSSRVGGNTQITIRGTSTLLGNHDPLWVVDGVIQPDNLSLDISGGVTDDLKNIIGNQISWLNPDDIDEITVLRDASATAIYGSKASNGVIVITTKKNATDRLSVRYSLNMTVRQRPNYSMFDFMNSKERIQFGKEAYDAGARYQNEPIMQPYTYEGLMNMYNNHKISESEFMEQMKFLETNNTNWFKTLCRNSFSQKHNVSLSGGSAKTSFNASMSYSNNRGTSIGDDLSQFTARLNVSTMVGKKVKLNFNLNFSNSDHDGYGGSTTPEGYARKTSRAIPLYDQNGDRVYYQQKYRYKYNSNQLYYGYNILNELENSYSTNAASRFSGSIDLDWKIIKGLSYQCVLSYANSRNETESYSGEKTSYIETNYRGYAYGSTEVGSALYNAAMMPFGGELTNYNLKSISYNMQHKFQASYTIAKKHRLNGLAAVEVRSEEYRNAATTAYGYVPDRGEMLVTPTYPGNITPIGITTDTQFGALTSLYEGGKWSRTSLTNNYVSLFAIFAYSYDNRYVLNANIRGDASNRFGQDVSKRFEPTYSVGVSWHAAEEHFIKDKQWWHWLDRLNLGATFGVQGYTVSTMSPELIASYGGILEGYNEYYSTVSSVPNPYLKWEKTKTWNLSFDFGMFRKFSLNFNYYGRHSNAIVKQTVAEEYGKRTMYLNGGIITNQGVELTVNYTPIQSKRHKLVWTITFNTSKNFNSYDSQSYLQNDLDPLTLSDFLNGNSSRPLVKGKPISAFWSYDFAGLDHNTGYPTFNKLTHETNSKLDENNLSDNPADYLTYSGQTEPAFTGGISTRLRWRDFSLSMSFSTLLGYQKRLPNPYSDFGTNCKIPDPYYNLSRELNDRWKVPGDELNTNVPALYTEISTSNLLVDLPNGSSGNSIYTMWAQSSCRVVDASFLRCTNISLSYYLPTRICKKFYANSLSGTFSVTNPFVICSSRWRGFDPELGNSVMSRMFTFGISVGF